MFKKVVAMGLVVSMCAAMFGCGSTESTVSDVASSETTTASEEVVSIDWYVDLSWWSWGGDTWGTDLVSKTILEETGVEINFIVPASDGGEQLSTMVATDSLPDVITFDGWWSTEGRTLSNSLAMEGYIWSYNELIDTYAPSMWDVIRSDMFAWHAEADGDTYLLENYSYSEQDLEAGELLMPNGAIVVRQDMWEAIGSPDMSTPEAFLAACEMVQDEIGTYNGQTIIPIQMYEGVGNSIIWLSQYFATPYEDEDGNWLYDFTEDNYKDSLAFLNDAYNRGLISDANFSDTRDLVNEKVASGRVFAMIVAPQDFITSYQTLYDMDNDAVYMPVVLHNYEGEEPVLQDIRGVGWLTTAITKNAENPEAIIKLFEYLLSDEGQLLVTYGVEGITFEYNDEGKIEYTEEYLTAQVNNDTKQYGLGSLIMLDNYALRRNWEAEPTDARTIATSEATLKAGLEEYAYDFNANGLKIDPADERFDDMMDIKTDLGNIEDRAIASLIIAGSEEEFEALYESTIADLEAAGLNEWIEFANQYFQVAKEALGITSSWGVRN